jgi:hypothetical protein
MEDILKGFEKVILEDVFVSWRRDSVNMVGPLENTWRK